MSILNVWISPERALIASDSEAAAVDGPGARVSKFFTIPHLDVVIGHRGCAQYFCFMASVLQMLSLARDIETILDTLPAYLSPMIEQTKLAMTTHYGWKKIDTDLVDGESLVVVGWSHKQGRMVAREFTQMTLAEGFVVRDIDPCYISPYDESINQGEYPENATSMEKLVRAQVRLIKDKEPKAAAGGNLMLCQLRRGSVQIVRGCEL